jgi:two-component system sensor histidine kinase DegS
MSVSLSALADDLEQDQQTLQRELDEIEMLLRQATSEVERNESRRVQAEQHLAQVERGSGEPPEVVEARAQLLNQTRRATLMQAQLDVLAGKQRALQRYRDRVSGALPVVRSGAAALPSAASETAHGASGASGDVLAAQEQMRREIARQMHDGPAQSIANIALQAEIVQRLFERDPERATPELKELVTMVQQALEATKAFIFDVRPMVLDDLGLVPTLRRTAAERSRRSGVPVRFESAGTDRRLRTESESGLFRMVDDAVGAFLGVGATSVVVRLDWSENQVRATIGASSPTAEQSAEQRAKAAVATARRDRALPNQLASMIHEQEDADAARTAGLPAGVLAEIENRASTLAVAVKLSEDRWSLELTVGR